MDPALCQRLSRVTGDIADAARAAHRDPASITTVVVTKFHPVSLVRDLHTLGMRDFGESRHQEAQPKVEELRDLEATWHFVGQVQSKKAQQIAVYSHIIHSVDRESLVDALGTNDRGVFIQVNLTDDHERGGVHPDALPALVDRVAGTSLRLLGLMAVAPLDGEPRRAFARLRELSTLATAIIPGAGALSMGMSGDFRDAILEGATHLRIGTAITGNRLREG